MLGKQITLSVLVVHNTIFLFFSMLLFHVSIESKPPACVVSTIFDLAGEASSLVVRLHMPLQSCSPLERFATVFHLARENCSNVDGLAMLHHTSFSVEKLVT